MRPGLTLGTIAVILAAINGLYHWSSAVAWFLCLLIAIAAIVYVNDLHTGISNRIGDHRWHELVYLFWGAVVALVLVTGVEVYLGYLFYCSTDFEDTLLYRLCLGDYGAYFSRPPDLYAPGERQIVSAINFFHEHAHEIEVFLVPVILVITVLTSELLHYIRPQPAAAGGGAPPAWWHELLQKARTRAFHVLEFLFKKAAPFASGALLTISFFAFGGVVVGNEKSYRATVAMLNANTEMKGSLRRLPAEIAARTRQVEAITELLRDEDSVSTDPRRAKWRAELRQIVEDLRRLEGELKKARGLDASPRDLEPYRADNVVGSERAPEYHVIRRVDASDLYRSGRHDEPPVIKGPVAPSGAESRYKDASAAVDDFNENLLPRYETAKDLLTDAVYRTSGIRFPEEAAIARTASALIVRASARDPEGGNALQEVTEAGQRIEDAQDHVGCLNLVLEFNRLAKTTEGQDALKKIIADNVASPAGFVRTQSYLTKVRAIIGDGSPDQISAFRRELEANGGWQETISSLASERRQQFPGDVSENFNNSIRAAFRDILGRACAARMPFERLAAALQQLG
jgi:hypothetical protein